VVTTIQYWFSLTPTNDFHIVRASTTMKRLGKALRVLSQNDGPCRAAVWSHIRPMARNWGALGAGAMEFVASIQCNWAAGLHASYHTPRRISRSAFVRRRRDRLLTRAFRGASRAALRPALVYRLRGRWGHTNGITRAIAWPIGAAARHWPQVQRAWQLRPSGASGAFAGLV